jgi:hypothetical protein
MSIDPTVTVHPSAIVDDGATIGAGSRNGPGLWSSDRLRITSIET